MELRHLRYFVAVAEELHFSRAAKRLNMSQPPLSNQIAQLEDIIGTKLFNRTKRTVELTESGEIFLKHTYELFNLLENAVENTKRMGDGSSGKLIVGYTGSWSNKMLHFLRYYRNAFPDVKVLLHQLSTGEQLIALQKKEIDLGILAHPRDRSYLHLQTIHNEPFYAALPISHPLAKGEGDLHLAHLKEDPFILPPRQIGPGYYDTLISLCNRAGFSPKIIQETEGLFTILTLVSAEIGVSIVSGLALEHPKKGVTFRKLSDDSLRLKLFLAWPKTKASPVAIQFVQTYNNYFKNSLSGSTLKK